MINVFPCSLTRKITTHSVENRAFHGLLRWEMTIPSILTSYLTHIFLFERSWECTFWTWEWKGWSKDFQWQFLIVYGLDYCGQTFGLRNTRLSIKTKAITSCYYGVQNRTWLVGIRHVQVHMNLLELQLILVQCSFNAALMHRPTSNEARTDDCLDHWDGVLSCRLVNYVNLS